MTENEDDPIYEWDDERDAIAPDQSMSVLQQLQLYQHMARYVYPYLDAYETSALVQILDRVTGWRKHEARFSADALFAGDRMYGGIARTMDRSRMMKALRSLERRDLIRRRPSEGSRIRIYWVNPNPDISSLQLSAPALRKSAARVGSRRRLRVSSGDNPVHQADYLASHGDTRISESDTGERYLENGIREGNIENGTRPEPAAPDARSPEDFSQLKARSLAQARGKVRPEVNPRPRSRRPT